MHLPEPIPTTIRDESFAEVTYHIRGELVPELQVELGPGSVMFEHHVLLWKEPRVEIELKKLPGGVKRKIAGLDFFVTRTVGAGPIAFSRDCARPVHPAAPEAGEGLNVREHQFIAATDNLDYTYERVKGIRNMLLGGLGLLHRQLPRRQPATRSCGCTARATSSSSSSTPASSSTSRPAAGSTRTPGHDGVGHDGPEDGPDGRRRQAHLEPLHRPRAASRSRRCTSRRSRPRPAAQTAPPEPGGA